MRPRNNPAGTLPARARHRFGSLAAALRGGELFIAGRTASTPGPLPAPGCRATRPLLARRHPGGFPVSPHEVGPGCFLDPPTGNQNEIPGRTSRRPPVHLPQQTLGPRSLDGASYLAAGNHPETRRPGTRGFRQTEGHHVSGNTARTPGQDRLELRGPPDPLVSTKRFVASACRERCAATRRAVLSHDRAPGSAMVPLR